MRVRVVGEASSEVRDCGGKKELSRWRGWMDDRNDLSKFPFSMTVEGFAYAQNPPVVASIDVQKYFERRQIALHQGETVVGGRGGEGVLDLPSFQGEIGSALS